MHRRRHLVLVRAGEKSLHREWLGEDRTWDLVVSWYGDEPYEPVSDETVIAVKGGSGDGIFDTFAKLPRLLKQYDLFWLPDDDIEADCAGINRLFAIASQHRLPLSQPALTHDSYFSHPHTLASPSFLLRYTTFVEVMVPCLSRAKLKAVLPLFEDHPSLFGVDMIWARLDTGEPARAAIIDEVAVRHTRPVGTFLLPALKAGGADPVGKKEKLISEYGIPARDKSFRCYGGLSRSGRRYGGLATRLVMLFDYLRQSGQWRQPRAARSILRMFKRLPPGRSQFSPVTAGNGPAGPRLATRVRRGP